MQFISFCLFTIIFGYSLVISAPVKSTTPDSQETKHQKATAIASRLLKELHGEESTHQDGSKDTIIPVNHPATEKVESHIPKQNNNDVADDGNDNDDEEEIEFTPTIDDLYEIYANNNYGQLPVDEESSSELADDDYVLPISQQQLIRYLAEQEESDEQITPVVHTPVMDDTIMSAENHRRRRRRSVY